ncbi:MAG: LemA family protein [Xanthomonadales bacterium]|nr:LemA family protein [Xanthomonadales bacterium]
MTTALLLVVVLGALVAWGYNRLIRHRNLVAEARAGIDVQLLKRHQLVPALVETVRGYARHEAETLEGVTALRQPDRLSMDDLNRQERSLGDDIGRLFALAEDYPELRADENFRQLSTQLVEVEDHLQYARRYFNGTVRDYNNEVERFPSNLIAQTFRFRKAEFFEVDNAAQRRNPDVAL